ncbi:P-loop containing nucleoside triphosphate hydrolase protein [Piromyces finnis]|uniref:p-loop containing nucleoside triphosphate hydrolase protein n=1 Tax=Piromyces finnis TaxID=1754191 RepID=A0A1Y1VE73_9FUNG|nr:P-loop containing nucleoside triphosphate hydrolase protein [Piromyces finnis]|eukprot:ORX54164.1 P-loop containing nucleoside triphosphate hydrolase protein [Piromyces finnis]
MHNCTTSVNHITNHDNIIITQGLRIFPEKVQSYMNINYEDYIVKIVFIFGFSYLFIVNAFILLKDYRDQKIYILKAVNILTGMGLNELYTTTMPNYFLLWPFFSFCNIIYTISQYVMDDNKKLWNLDLLNNLKNPIGRNNLFILIDLLILFIIYGLYQIIFKKRVLCYFFKRSNILNKWLTKSNNTVNGYFDHKTIKDRDFNNYYHYCENSQDELIVSNVSMIYKGGNEKSFLKNIIKKITDLLNRNSNIENENNEDMNQKELKLVLDKINFSIKENEVFGLLGPNGSGKTTLCKILTNYIQPCTGSVQFQDKIINSSENNYLYYKNYYFGICPQNDILWDELNAIEHLKIFSKIKGIPHRYEKQIILKCMENVGIHDMVSTNIRKKLENYKHCHSKKNVKFMTGGEKRRLSLALSLIGNPKMVILDEPTTGIDPLMRNNLWSVISELKKSLSILLITHNMEEANALCNRIGIIVNGTMECIGSPLELKNYYGNGYTLTVLVTTSIYKIETIKRFIEEKVFIGFPFKFYCENFKDDNSKFIYVFEKNINILMNVFKVITTDEAYHYGIREFELNQTSLEDVLHNIITKSSH